MNKVLNVRRLRVDAWYGIIYIAIRRLKSILGTTKLLGHLCQFSSQCLPLLKTEGDLKADRAGISMQAIDLC
jgi:hypothetical protein